MNELISIDQAASRNIKLIRKPIWANAMDHIRIDIVDGRAGPWLHLYAPFNVECNGRDPVPIAALGNGYDVIEWEPYAGPLPDSEEYKADVAGYAKFSKGHP